MSETTMEAQEGPVRAFWPTDYARFARVVRDVRKREGDFAADSLAAAVSGVLHADSPDGFDLDKFERGTHETPRHYGELARVLKQARHVKCEPWTAKPAEQQAGVDAMEATLAGFFTASDPRFDLAKFVKSAQHPVPASTSGDSDSVEDDDTDELDDES